MLYPLLQASIGSSFLLVLSINGQKYITDLTLVSLLYSYGGGTCAMVHVPSSKPTIRVAVSSSTLSSAGRWPSHKPSVFLYLVNKKYIFTCLF